MTNEISKNSIHYKAVYQDYDWCYQNYVINGMTHEEMAKFANCSVRVIKKWCVEKHRITNRYRYQEGKITDRQRSIIIGGLLGDGHIDRREDYPLYILCHAENQKDYLFWTYKELKNLCNSAPKHYKGKENCIVVNSVCNTQDYYRLETRSYECLKELRQMTLIELIDNLDPLSFAIWILDDGCYNRKSWKICLPFSKTDCDYIIESVRQKFGINGKLYLHPTTNFYYLRFVRSDSNIINNIILSIFPQNLDIIQYKIGNDKVAV